MAESLVRTTTVGMSNRTNNRGDGLPSIGQGKQPTMGFTGGSEKFLRRTLRGNSLVPTPSWSSLTTTMPSRSDKLFRLPLVFLSSLSPPFQLFYLQCTFHLRARPVPFRFSNRFIRCIALYS